MTVSALNFCVCGHVEDWHPSVPTFPCEYDGCDCERFSLRVAPVPRESKG